MVVYAPHPSAAVLLSVGVMPGLSDLHIFVSDNLPGVVINHRMQHSGWGESCSVLLPYIILLLHLKHRALKACVARRTHSLNSFTPHAPIQHEVSLGISTISCMTLIPVGSDFSFTRVWYAFSLILIILELACSCD